MSQSYLKFKINNPHVVAENFGDEIIAINLDTGSYYSVGKSGVTVWTLVSAGATLNEIMTEVSQRYTGEQLAMEQTVQQFWAELQRLQLIVPCPNGGDADPTSGPGQAPVLYGKARFEPPLLREYTDMQELLLLDPIHDVTESGWPYAKQA